MTDTNFCCLCASDEGVFLDIFTASDRQLGNRSFLKEFETCLSVKVDRNESLSSRICHRCAIELGQCNEFVNKYKSICEATPRLKKSVLKKSCCLCLSTDKKNCLFTLAKDFRSRIDPLQKIYECFNIQITRQEAESRSICLLCRYNLDLLYDLRKLAAEANSKLKRIAESRAILASLPKTNTFVVNRKTTLICQSKVELETLSDSESDCDTMARKRSRSKKPVTQRTPLELKLRTCGQCHTLIEGGIDMYRLHSTGVTVCKMCWITMDPFNPNRTNKRKRQNENEANTRLCAVFLKDVMSPASSKDNGQPSKVEKDSEGNPVYVVSDESSDAEEKSALKSNRKKQNRRAASRSSEESDTKSRMRLKRGLKSDEGSNKKLKSAKNETAIATVSTRLRKSSRYQSSDSDSTKAESKQSDTSDVKNNTGNKGKNVVKSSDDNSGDKPIKVIKLNKKDGRRKAAMKSKSEDSASSGDGEAGRKLRKVRNKVELNLKPKLTEIEKNEKNPKRLEPRTPAPNETHTVSKNPSIKLTDKIQSPKIKLSPKRSKNLMMVSFPFKLKDRYECKVCKTEYKNRVIGMKHELTHFKQVEIKIEKLNINRHFQTIDQNSTTTELPDATTCSIDLSSKNDKPLQSEVPSSTSPSGTDEDQSNDPDRQVDEEESIQRSKRSESIQQDDKPSDIDDAKETDAVSSSNGPLGEEPVVKINDGKSEIESTDNVASELSTETNNVLPKVDTSSVEADSATETNAIDEDKEGKISEKNADEDSKKEQISEELDRSVKDTEEKENHEEEKTDREVETSLQKSATNNKADEIEKDRDLVEEIESETDIRIVDSGSSVENSSERTEKHAEGEEKIASNVTATNIDDLAKSSDTEIEEESKSSDDSKAKRVAIDELEAEVTSTIASENNIVERNESNGDVNSQTDGESVEEFRASELSRKIEEELRPINTVTEILQEVIDLATAEVKKRVESEVVSVPETLENISEEIKKTAEGSVTADEILASFEAATNKETESYKLDLNSTTNSLKNHLEVSATDV